MRRGSLPQSALKSHRRKPSALMKSIQMEVVLGKESGERKEKVQFAKQELMGEGLRRMQNEEVLGQAQRSQKWSIARGRDTEKGLSGSIAFMGGGSPSEKGSSWEKEATGSP